MAQGNHSPANKNAQLVLANTALQAQGDQLAKLQSAATEQLAAIPRLETEAAARAVLAGLTLHRVKASLAHGEWMPWMKQIGVSVGTTGGEQIRTSGSNLKAEAKRQAANLRLANYYMKLATTFVAKAKVTKPDLLALPGDQTQLALGSGEGEARAFFGKLEKFVGQKSLNELLSEHGIKEGKKLGGAREKSDESGEAPLPVITAEQLADQKRAELADWLETGRQYLLHENACSHLSADEIRDFATGLDGMLAQWKRGLKETLKHAEAIVIEPAAEPVAEAVTVE